MAAEHPTNTITVVLGRDHVEWVNALPGMTLGTYEAGSDAGATADRIDQLGAHRVDMPELVDLSEAAQPTLAIRALTLVKELTRYGIMVGWRLRLGRHNWRTLNHLWPPQEVLGATDDVVSRWRHTHYIGKCMYRYGPGFVQVRDRRHDELAKFTIDDDAYIAAMTALLDGASVRDIPDEILTDYASENLVTQVGDLALWLPYRVRRWPMPSMGV